MNNQKLVDISTGTGCITTSSGINLQSSGTLTNYDSYGPPVLLAAYVYPDRVEHVYRRESMMALLSWPGRQYDPQIYKIIITWKDGQTSKENVMGKYVSPCAQYYSFDDEETID